MKKFAILLLLPCILFPGCSHSQESSAETHPITLEVESIPTPESAAEADTVAESQAPAVSESTESEATASEAAASESAASEAATANPAASETTAKPDGSEPAASETTAKPDRSESAASETAVTVYPLPDTTMDALEQSTLAVSLKEGDAYVDDTGVMQMHVTVYTYDLYDMVDINGLKPGDVIVTHSGETAITSIESNDLGTIFINGGLEEGGFDLFSDGGGVYYETGFNDIKNWYAAGEVTLRVSDELQFHDKMDPDKGTQIYYAGSFLTGEVTDYNFTPNNTTIRTENGQIVSMERIYTP